MNATLPYAASSFFYSDDRFDAIYSTTARAHSARHWTPLTVARKAAAFLASHEGARVLDIGSGVGKFCLAAGHWFRQVQWHGVEQRPHFVAEAKAAGRKLGLQNISFVNCNLTQLDLRAYDHFYFFNSFYENLHTQDAIDDSVTVCRQLYHQYTQYLYRQFRVLPSGTRVATFHSPEDAMPADFKIVGSDCNDLLVYWIKV